MPKRALPPIASVPITALQPPPPPSPLVQKLRTDWRWAGISQFIWTFSDAFGLLDWDIEALEADLDRVETALLPDLIAKLLYALTYNRQINRTNAFYHLHKQYLKRVPDSTTLGTEEEPRPWAALGLSEKLLWDLCEWQMADPARFRALLKSEEEATTWRIEPVGWDKEGNTYYLFDDNRLWIQRVPPPPPRPPKKTSQKAKRAQKKSLLKSTADPSSETPKPKSKSHRKKIPLSPELTPPPPIVEESPVSGRRKRTQVAFYGNPTPTVQALKRGGPSVPADTPGSSKVTRSSSRLVPGSTSATAMVHTTPSRPSNKPAPVSLSASNSAPRSTRASRRAMGGGEEWQEIPEEWLQPEASSSTIRESKNQPGKAKKARGKGEGRRQEDEESELSALTDEEEHQARLKGLGLDEVKKIESRASMEETPLTDLESVSSPGAAIVVDEEVPIAEHISEAKTAVDEDIPPSPADDVLDAQVEPEPTSESMQIDGVRETKEVVQAPEEMQVDTAEETVNVNEVPVSPAAGAEANTPVAAHKEGGKGEREEGKKEEMVVGDIGDVAKQETAPEAHSLPTNGHIGLEKTGSLPPEEEKIPDGLDNMPIETVAGQAEVEPVKPENGISGVEKDVKEEVKAEEDLSHVPPGFVEWEAICVTLYDWRTFPEQFANSRDPDEKNLYQLLHEEVGPKVIEALIAKEQERLKQEAINNRKRSSRIATRELEKEEIARREAAEREMEERMDKSRREEIARAKAEAVAVTQEKAREERLKEREERIAARESAVMQKVMSEQKMKDKADRARIRRQRRREGEVVESSSEEEGGEVRSARALSKRGRADSQPAAVQEPKGGNGAETQADEGWELSCEVCRKTGWNVDDEQDVVCCDDCGRWQHTECHNRQDMAEGRPLRNWDKVDFKCKDCRRRAARKRQRLSEGYQSSPLATPDRANGSNVQQQAQSPSVPRSLPPVNGTALALPSTRAPPHNDLSRPITGSVPRSGATSSQLPHVQQGYPVHQYLPHQQSQHPDPLQALQRPYPTYSASSLPHAVLAHRPGTHASNGSLPPQHPQPYHVAQHSHPTQPHQQYLPHPSVPPTLPHQLHQPQPQHQHPGHASSHHSHHESGQYRQPTTSTTLPPIKDARRSETGAPPRPQHHYDIPMNGGNQAVQLPPIGRPDQYRSSNQRESAHHPSQPVPQQVYHAIPHSASHPFGPSSSSPRLHQQMPGSGPGSVSGHYPGQHQHPHQPHQRQYPHSQHQPAQPIHSASQYPGPTGPQYARHPSSSPHMPITAASHAPRTHHSAGSQQQYPISANQNRHPAGPAPSAPSV